MFDFNRARIEIFINKYFNIYTHKQGENYTHTLTYSARILYISNKQPEISSNHLLTKSNCVNESSEFYYSKMKHDALQKYTKFNIVLHLLRFHSFFEDSLT